MKISIVYESKTGNTKLLADKISEVCKETNDIILLSAKEAMQSKELAETELYFLGSWTNKGSCGVDMQEFAKTLENEQVAIFGTCGFGGSQDYYDQLAQRFEEVLSDSNTVLNSFYCQGKMPAGIRARYVSMLQEHPDDEKLEVNIENFDKAQTHPDNNDLEMVKEFTKEILKIM